MKKTALLILSLFSAAWLFAQDPSNEMFTLTQIRKDVTSLQASSFDKSGGNRDCMVALQDGAKATLLDVQGAGVINRIWITIAPEADKISRYDLILRMYWDGNEFPSVESPVGPFFGNGWNETYDFISLPLSIAPGAGKSYVCYFTMPFAEGAKIEIENQSGVELSNLYFNINYLKMNQLPNNTGRFHAWFNHELTEAHPDGENEWGLLGQQGTNRTGAGNYLFAQIEGAGHIVGVNYYVNCPTTMWYGEGDEMIFIDGDTLPTLNGTGTEDFFNTSWCPKELFRHPYYGYPRVNNETGWLGRTHVYRFFISDPIYFNSSCLFTIEHGHNNNLTLDLASVTYWYQEKASALPRSLTREERRFKPIIGPAQIHMWRNAWRIEKDNEPQLWGDENE